jgi:hypothetical protein
MTEAEIENELQTLKAQLALLQEEHAKTRFGWLYWLRNTGFLLMVLGIAVFLGVLQVHGKIESNPVAMTLGVMAIFLFLMGAWVAMWSLRPLAERIMKVAPRW